MLHEVKEGKNYVGILIYMNISLSTNLLFLKSAHDDNIGLV